MARKLSLLEIRESSAQLSRLLSSLQHPLSPEGKRVLAAAKVGLQLIRDSRKDSKEKAVPKRKFSTAQSTREENLPDSIRELLALHRKVLGDDAHPTLPLRPDRA